MFAVTALIVAQPIAMALLRVLGKPITKLHWWTLGAIVVFGGITLAIQDPFFIKIKSTVFYYVFATVIAVSILIGKIPAKVVFAKALQLEVADKSWKNMSWQWVVLGIFLGSLNLYTALFLDEATWVNFRTFVFPAVITLTLILQMFFLYKSSNISKVQLYIQSCLQQKLNPEQLTINDVSDEHIGHAEADKGKHFEVIIKSSNLTSSSVLENHRKIYSALGDLEANGIHALSIKILKNT